MCYPIGGVEVGERQAVVLSDYSVNWGDKGGSPYLPECQVMLAKWPLGND